MMTPHQKLMATVCQLGGEEVEVLTLIAERLLVGQRQYGLMRLQVDSRNFHKEAIEECCDGLVYGACALLRDQQRAENLRERETG